MAASDKLTKDKTFIPNVLDALETLKWAVKYDANYNWSDAARLNTLKYTTDSSPAPEPSPEIDPPAPEPSPETEPAPEPSPETEPPSPEPEPEPETQPEPEPASFVISLVNNTTDVTLNENTNLFILFNSTYRVDNWVISGNDNSYFEIIQPRDAPQTEAERENPNFVGAIQRKKGVLKWNSDEFESAYNNSDQGFPDYETPLDSDGNNVYEVTVKARDVDGNVSNEISLTITIIDLYEPEPVPEPSPETEPEPEPQPEPSPETEPEPVPQPEPSPETEPEPVPEPSPETEPEPVPEPVPQPNQNQKHYLYLILYLREREVLIFLQKN